MSIDADFSHTTLWLDKTRAKLTSLTNDSIFYKTNAAAVEFGCDKKIKVDGEDKDFIIAAKTYEDRIIFTINPAIPYTAYSEAEREGKAFVGLAEPVTPFLRVITSWSFIFALSSFRVHASP